MGYFGEIWKSPFFLSYGLLGKKWRFSSFTKIPHVGTLNLCQKMPDKMKKRFLIGDVRLSLYQKLSKSLWSNKVKNQLDKILLIGLSWSEQVYQTAASGAAGCVLCVLGWAHNLGFFFQIWTLLGRIVRMRTQWSCWWIKIKIKTS